LAIAAAARKSSMRLLVQEPMNTRCTGISASSVFGFSCMYCSARSTAARCIGSLMSAGSGTRPVIGAVCSGLVPQVTCGAIWLASSEVLLSNCAPGSEGRLRQ
jgi:hypothetical protein